jgi:hypothetical protein
MILPAELEAAKLRMVESRKALEDYEKLKGFAASIEHEKLTKIFRRFTEAYLRLSDHQR